MDTPTHFAAYWTTQAHHWFSKDRAFDATLRARFLDLHEAAAKGLLDEERSTPLGALGLVLLLDQFPRNAFRGTARMYTTDAQARHHADLALRAGFDTHVDTTLRLFFYLPFAHAEDLAAQDRSVALHKRIGYLDNARRHRDIIARFGRFPHRNPILGRHMTAAEQAYLDAGGFAG